MPVNGRDSSLRAERRPGIATLVIVVVVVVVLAVAGAAVYVFAFTSPGTPGAGTTTTTLKIGTTVSYASTSTSQGYEYYKGTFTYTNPLGPFGINDSSGKPVEWNSTQTASGTFTFSINTATYLGTGSGQGTITVTTRGYCTGTAVVPYTFTITAGHPPGESYFVGFENPTPENVTVSLTCQGSTQGFNTSNNPVSYLSVYPNEVTPATIPFTTTQPPTAGISYTVTIEPVS
jgi:hypothetical protein